MISFYSYQQALTSGPIHILLTVLGHAALLNAGPSRGVVHVLAQVLLRVLFLSSVAPSLPVHSGVPDTTERRALNIRKGNLS